MTNRIGSENPIIRALFEEAARQHLTVSDLSAMTARSRNSITNWKHGHALPSIVDITIMAEQLGLSINLTRTL